MRRIAALTVTLLALAPASAFAVTNTVKLTARMQMLFAPSASAPAPLNFEFIQDVNTNPGGQQPNASSGIEVFFAKQIESNAKYFPTCAFAELDGQPDIPSQCRPAVVGNGFAVAYAGQPGQELAYSVREEMAVTLLNGTPAGQQWLLHLKSSPSAPVVINRALAGTVVGGSDPYGFSVRFQIPYDLQNQLGLSIALTKLVVNIPSEVHPVTVDGTVYNASFLRIASCDGSLPALDEVEFSLDGGYPGYPGYPYFGQLVQAFTDVACAIGPGFPYYPPAYPPAGYPNNPPLPPAGGGSSGGGDNGSGSGAGGSTPGSGSPPPGGGSGGPPPPPTPPRISGSSRTKTAVVRADGSFMLPGVTVVCPAGGGDCTVDVIGTAASGASAARALAKAHFNLKAGRSSAVKLKLTKRGKKLLKRKRSLKLAVRLSVRKANGARATRTFKTTIRAKKPAHRH